MDSNHRPRSYQDSHRQYPTLSHTDSGRTHNAVSVASNPNKPTGYLQSPSAGNGTRSWIYVSLLCDCLRLKPLLWFWPLFGGRLPVFSRQIVGPSLHQLPALVKELGAYIGRLRGIPHNCEPALLPPPSTALQCIPRPSCGKNCGNREGRRESPAASAERSVPNPMPLPIGMLGKSSTCGPLISHAAARTPQPCRIG